MSKSGQTVFMYSGLRTYGASYDPSSSMSLAPDYPDTVVEIYDTWINTTNWGIFKCMDATPNELKWVKYTTTEFLNT